MTSTLTEPLEPAAPRPVKSRRRPPAARKLFDPAITKQAIKDSFVKLNPRTMIRNPVMFVVEVGSVLTTILFFRDLGSSTANANVFAGMVSLWLWFTVLFANFAEAMAEGRGKAQAATLRKTRAETMANVRQADGSVIQKASTALQVGDLCVVVAGEVIPGDGDVVEGLATVDESAITGESAPVIRESGGDRSAVTGGTRVLSDEITVRITSKPGETFLDRMIALVEGASRQKTPNEIALTILLAGLTIIFLLSVVTLQPFAIYSEAEQSIIVLVALLVCLIPTTIGALLSAIGIAGMDRLVQRNVLAMSGRAVEAAGDVNTLLLDKTGTITFGSRQAAEFVPVLGVDERHLAEVAMLSSLADETPEGRSIVAFAAERYHLVVPEAPEAVLVPFTAQTRMSGMDFVGGRSVRKGAADSVRTLVLEEGGAVPIELAPIVDGISRDGATPLAVFDRQGTERAPHPRGDPAQGHGEARDERAVRRAPGHGHPHGDGHRRQPVDRGRHREGSGRRRLPGRGDARGQDGADPARAGGRAPHRHDRRRHERRSCAGAGRRRRGHEHRYAGGEGSREHGRPRLEPDQAHRDRRDRQAAPDHARLAHDLLDRQRHRQVLRHHPGHVRGCPAGARFPQHHAAGRRRARPSSRPSSSTP